MSKERLTKIQIVLAFFMLVIAIWNISLTIQGKKLDEKVNQIANFEPNILSMKLDNTVISEKQDLKNEPRQTYGKNLNLKLQGVSPHLEEVRIVSYNFSINKKIEPMLLDYRKDGIEFGDDFKLKLEIPEPVITSPVSWSTIFSLPIEANFMVTDYYAKELDLGNLTILLTYRDLQTLKSKEYNITTNLVWVND